MLVLCAIQVLRSSASGQCCRYLLQAELSADNPPTVSLSVNSLVRGTLFQMATCAHHFGQFYTRHYLETSLTACKQLVISSQDISSRSRCLRGSEHIVRCKRKQYIDKKLVGARRTLNEPNEVRQAGFMAMQRQQRNRANWIQHYIICSRIEGDSYYSGTSGSINPIFWSFSIYINSTQPQAISPKPREAHLISQWPLSLARIRDTRSSDVRVTGFRYLTTTLTLKTVPAPKSACLLYFMHVIATCNKTPFPKFLNLTSET